MRGIAARLGVSATALYQHFESKAQILRAIRSDGLGRLTDALEPALSIADPVERLSEMAVGYVQFARANPWLYNVLMEQEHVEWQDLPPDEIKRLLAPLAAVRDCLRVGVEQGNLRSTLDINTASFQLWAAVHGISSLMISGRISEQHPAIPVPNEGAFLRAFVRGVIEGFTG